MLKTYEGRTQWVLSKNPNPEPEPIEPKNPLGSQFRVRTHWVLTLRTQNGRTQWVGLGWDFASERARRLRN